MLFILFVECKESLIEWRTKEFEIQFIMEKNWMLVLLLKKEMNKSCHDLDFLVQIEIMISLYATKEPRQTTNTI